jgi:hypothetical protein
MKMLLSLALFMTVLLPLSALAETIYPGQSSNGVSCQAFPTNYSCNCYDNWSNSITATVTVQGPAGDVNSIRTSAQKLCEQTNLAHGFNVTSCTNVLF